MEFGSAAGGGVILALAAGLWLVYLVPSWLRRSEFDATERNAVRLQQTLRVLAETSEVPEAVRAEATARSVAEQQKVLKQHQQVMDAAARTRAAASARAAARELAAVQPTGVAVVEAKSTAARRLRRTRSVTSVLLLAALVAVGVGTPLLLQGVTWLVAALGGVVAVSSIALLGRLAAVSRSRKVVRVVAAPARNLRRRSVPAPVVEVAPVEAPVQRSWTPVGVPAPLYQSRAAAPAPAFDAAAVKAELRAAAAAADEALRAAASAPEVAPIERAAPSRFAAMGVIDVAETQTPDLDAVLRRRRESA